MKRGLIILLVGLAVAAAGYGLAYHSGMHSTRSMIQNDHPELVWLKDEFKLSDKEFLHVCELHEAYRPHCAEMCRQIEAQSEKLRSLLAGSSRRTPEIDAAMAEASRLRLECHRAMLDHFFRVSHTMPPEQGRRYLAWVQEKALLDRHGMDEGRQAMN